MTRGRTARRNAARSRSRIPIPIPMRRCRTRSRCRTRCRCRCRTRVRVRVRIRIRVWDADGLLVVVYAMTRKGPRAAPRCSPLLEPPSMLDDAQSPRATTFGPLREPRAMRSSRRSLAELGPSATSGALDAARAIARTAQSAASIGSSIGPPIAKTHRALAAERRIRIYGHVRGPSRSLAARKDTRRARDRSTRTRTAVRSARHGPFALLAMTRKDLEHDLRRI